VRRQTAQGYVAVCANEQIIRFPYENLGSHLFCCNHVGSINAVLNAMCLYLFRAAWVSAELYFSFSLDQSVRIHVVVGVVVGGGQQGISGVKSVARRLRRRLRRMMMTRPEEAERKKKR
jgi:predicted Rdx family selenoprotein